jgi:hypothetical protein
MLARFLTLLAALLLFVSCGADSAETDPGTSDPGPVEVDTSGTLGEGITADPGTGEVLDEGGDQSKDPGLTAGDDGGAAPLDEGDEGADAEKPVDEGDQGDDGTGGEDIPDADPGVEDIPDAELPADDGTGGEDIPDGDPGDEDIQDIPDTPDEGGEPDIPIDPCACTGAFPVCAPGDIDYPCEQAAICDGFALEELAKGTCPEPGTCHGANACEDSERLPYVTCGYNAVEYATKCEVREAHGCKSWSDIVNADDIIECPGDCLTCNCECDDTWDPVCGSDGIDYTNICYLRQCSEGNPTLECSGQCVDYEGMGCAECAGQCEPVCAKDGQSYQSACAAECAGTTVKHKYECDKICVDEALVQPVCGTNGKTYQNYCKLYSDYATEAYEGACDCGGCADIPVSPVCGSDGVTYDNECEATACGGLTEFEPGICTCDCPNAYDPVCGDDGVTYPSQCVADCLGADNTTPGHCTDCDTEVRCSDYSLRACLAGMTYPSPAHATNLACTKVEGTAVETKEPCTDCEVDEDCNDLDPCTTDTCDDGTCAYAPIADCVETPVWDRPADCPAL